MKKAISAILAIVIIFQCLFVVQADATQKSRKKVNFLFDSLSKENSYEAYLKRYEGSATPDREIIIYGSDYSKSSDAKLEILKNFEGSRRDVLKWNDSGFVEWEVYIPETGLYNMALRYYPIEGKSSAIEREVLIDGERPFYEARNITFTRVWKDRDEIRRDNQDNDIRPGQIESPMWQVEVFKDTEGLHMDPFTFYFSEGKHTITLNAVREPVVIDYIKIYQHEKPRPYEEVYKEYQEKGYKPVYDISRKIQAERAFRKSDPTLYPLFDRSSPLMEPYSPKKIRLNAIGGNNWNKSGQWISWTFNVPEDGLYKIAIKYKQDIVLDVPVTRSIKIDGKVPFAEIERVQFLYDAGWQARVLGKDDKNPYYVYLEQGEHTIKMEVNIGEVSRIIRTIRQCAVDLYQLYTKIIMITGPEPDKLRDYQLDLRIEGIEDILRQNAAIISSQSEELRNISGSRISRAAMLDTVSRQLVSLADDIDSMPQRLNTFKDNLTNLSTWLLTAMEQPLTLDYIEFLPENAPAPRAKPNVFETLSHLFASFWASFTTDYSNIGNVYDDSQGKADVLKVWVLTGRDQADTIKAMIDDDFTQRTGINVNLNILQNENVLLFSTASGQGPDVSLNMSRTLPVDYGVRGALVDLKTLPGIEEVLKRYMPTATVPYEYNGSLYALPQQQSFPMLFYRKDILNEVGIGIPETWDDVYNMIAALQERNLQFGGGQAPGRALGQGQSIDLSGGGFELFNAFLLQLGGSYYSPDARRTELDSAIALEAVKKWTSLYTNYGLPQYYDFYNRFRTGEMPVGIANYTMYNMLSVAAPEIKGLWDFAPLPGTVDEKGNIIRTIGGAGTSNVILKSSKNIDKAWEFLKWWTSKETQVRYGRELEALMGPAARYDSANFEAVSNLPWPAQDYKKLRQQWQYVREIPVIPGGYYISRHLENAWKEVVFNGEIPRDILNKYVREINKEITKKRIEFGLED